MGKHSLCKSIKREYKNYKLFRHKCPDNVKYLKRRCKTIIEYFCEKFIFEQGLMFNYYIIFSSENSTWKVSWSYGINSSVEKKYVTNIVDIIDIGMLTLTLEKEYQIIISKDINNWNRNEPII